MRCVLNSPTLSRKQYFVTNRNFGPQMHRSDRCEHGRLFGEKSYCTVNSILWKQKRIM